MSGDTFAAAATVFRFGAFQLVPGRELLLDGDKPVHIGSRALRILTVLVERAGELVGKNELIDLVWPDTFVEEGNLKVHVAALRRILGDANSRMIANVPGRGYRFIADISRSEFLEAQPSAATNSSGFMPVLLTRVIGREEAVNDVRSLLTQHRFVTITGAGGIGKTTVAIAATDRLVVGLKDHTIFIELAAVPDPTLLAGTIASVLGIRAASNDPIGQIVELIGTKEMLLVLDNCEHVVQRAAEIVEFLLSRAPSLKILATSREPLHAQGEHIYRLAPLSFPVEDTTLDAKTALDYPAVALFVERARSGADAHVFGDADVLPVVQICRQLDGLPLALELAAARLQNFGFVHLASRLDDRFSLLTKGRRTALPRQKTLRATLDWSFELLTEREQTLLARLGIFADTFIFETVAAIYADPEEDLLDDLSNLADKSMLSVDASGDLVRYRLLESNKAYALDRLRLSGDFETIAARRARAMLDLFAVAKHQWTHEASRAWLLAHRSWIGDVRASVEWSFARDRDVELGASLLLETSQLWIGLGLLPEFFRHADRALDALARRDGHDKLLEMRLSSAVGHAIYEMGVNPALTPTMVRSFESALRLASELGDAREQVRALVSQCIGSIGTGEYADVLPLADRFVELGHKLPDMPVRLLYNQCCGIASMMMGRNADALRFLDAALKDPAMKYRANSHEGFDFDPVITTRNLEARLLWMAGFPDRALAVVREIAEDALALGHLPSYLSALQSTVMLIPVWYGDQAFHDDQLEKYVRYGQENNLDYRGLWRTVIALGWESGVENWSFAKTRKALIDLNTTFNNYGNEMFASYHPGLVYPHMIDRVRDGKSGWCAAEIIRAVGEERLEGGDLAGARAAFDEALGLAREQGARAWELRAAMSLCRLDGGVGRGRELLATVYETYTEGFGSNDLKAAAALLRQRAN